MLLEQIRHLRSRGHRIPLLYGGTGTAGHQVLPTWTSVRVDEEVLVPRDQSYSLYLSGCDVVVAGWFGQLPELAASGAPVFYLEQGDEEIFGELPSESEELLVREHLRQYYTQPVSVAAVSPFVFSAWYEGSGMPSLEAMASGGPVVETCCGGIDTHAVPGVNALLVEPGDVESLAAIVYLLDDPTGRSILSAAGREIALRFCLSDTIEHLEAPLRRVATSHQNTYPPERVLQLRLAVLATAQRRT